MLWMANTLNDDVVDSVNLKEVLSTGTSLRLAVIIGTPCE